MVMLDWNPELYLKFEQERTQPVRDLVARVGLSNPSRILDLGCGPANSTSVIQHRWPHALIMGLDNSMPMIEKAKEAHPDLQFIHADANEDLSSLGRFDLILANASAASRAAPQTGAFSSRTVR